MFFEFDAIVVRCKACGLINVADSPDPWIELPPFRGLSDEEYEARARDVWRRLRGRAVAILAARATA